MLLAPITYLLSGLLVRALHAGAVPILDGAVFRSRHEYSLDFYLQITQHYRLAAVIIQVILGVWLVLYGFGIRLDDVHETLLHGLSNHRSRQVLLLLTSASLVAFAVALFGPPVFDTNDDAFIAELIAGAWTGAPDPRAGFLGAMLARALTVGADRYQWVPWWGATLLAVQVASGGILLSIVVRSSAGAGRRPLWWLALASVVGLLIYSVLFVQFTHVAITAGAAGVLLLVDAIRRPQRRWVLGTLAALGFVLLAAEIRYEAFLLVTALVVVLALFPDVLRAPTSLPPALMAVAALLAFVAAVQALGSAAEERAAREIATAGWAAELFPGEACFGEAQSSSWQRVADVHAGPLTENDRKIIASWVRPTIDIFGPADSMARRIVPASPSSRTDCEFFPNQPRLPQELWVYGAVLLGAAAGTQWSSGREWRLATLLSTLPLGVLVALSAMSRAPNRVALPLLATSTVAMLVASTRRDEVADSSANVGRGAAAVAAIVVLAVSAQWFDVIAERAERARRDAVVRSAFEELVADVRVSTEPKAVLSWLDPLSESRPALTVPVSVRGGRPLGVAGWGTALPGHEELLRKQGLADWIGAVASDEQVLLAMPRERWPILARFMVERREMPCPRPRIVGRSGEWIIIATISDRCST